MTCSLSRLILKPVITATLEKTVNELSKDEKLELVAKIVTSLRGEEKSAQDNILSDTEKKKMILKQLTSRFKTYPIPANAPLKFTRDELHDRR